MRARIDGIGEVGQQVAGRSRKAKAPERRLVGFADGRRDDAAGVAGQPLPGLAPIAPEAEDASHDDPSLTAT